MARACRVLSVWSFLISFLMPMNTEANDSLKADSPSIYDIEAQSIDGKAVSMSDYQGKVVLIVNTASECGYTPQLAGLETLYQTYKDQGLVVLGFPSNDFGAQEPGTDEEIKAFCSATYQISFPLFSKIPVQGSDKHPLFARLTERNSDASLNGEIKWNFEKFLIDKDGKLHSRYASRLTPESSTLTGSIEALLKN